MKKEIALFIGCQIALFLGHMITSKLTGMKFETLALNHFLITVGYLMHLVWSKAI